MHNALNYPDNTETAIPMSINYHLHLLSEYSTAEISGISTSPCARADSCPFSSLKLFFPLPLLFPPFGWDFFYCFPRWALGLVRHCTSMSPNFHSIPINYQGLLGHIQSCRNFPDRSSTKSWQSNINLSNNIIPLGKNWRRLTCLCLKPRYERKTHLPLSVSGGWGKKTPQTRRKPGNQSVYSEKTAQKS